MPKPPEDDARQNVIDPSATIEHQDSVALANAVPSGQVVHFSPASVQSRLETLDTLSRRLHEQLSAIDKNLCSPTGDNNR